jgi:hypothetical protein
VAVYPEPNSAQVQIVPPGGPPAWLGAHGHVTGLKWSSRYPGGDDKASMTLEAPSSWRSSLLNVGSQVRICRGGHQVWDGALDAPEASGGTWSLTAVGSGNAAADYRAIWTTWPAGQPDQVINNAVGRGLNWANPTVGQPAGIWLGQQPDSGASNVQEVLDQAGARGGLGWQVSCQPGGLLGNDLTLAPLPTTPTRMLIVTDPVSRTSGGDVKTIFVRYQSSADNVSGSAAAAYAVTSVPNTGHGGTEGWLDLSSAGVLTEPAAQAVAAQILKIYVRAGFTKALPVAPGLLLTMGGVPVDPGCEKAGFMCRLIVTDFGYGGEVSPAVPMDVIAGGYEWNDHARTGTLTPYVTVASTLAGLLSATQQTMMAPVTAA